MSTIAIQSSLTASPRPWFTVLSRSILFVFAQALLALFLALNGGSSENHSDSQG